MYKLYFGRSKNIGLEIRLVVVRDCRKGESVNFKRIKENFLWEWKFYILFFGIGCVKNMRFLNLSNCIFK